MGAEQAGFVGHFGLGDAAHQMGAHVVRLGRWRIVGVAADVEVIVVGLKRGGVDDGREAVDGAEFVEGGDDLLDVFGQQVILCTAFEELAVGIDEQHFALALGGLAADTIGAVLHPLAKHQNAGRNAGAIEQVGRDANDGFE